jgi:hypothetical protein
VAAAALREDSGLAPQVAWTTKATPYVPTRVPNDAQVSVN